MGQCCKGERAIPRADFDVKDRARAVLVRAGDKVFREGLADFLRSAPRRPIAERVLLSGGGEGGKQKQGQRGNLQREAQVRFLQSANRSAEPFYPADAVSGHGRAVT